MSLSRLRGLGWWWLSIATTLSASPINPTVSSYDFSAQLKREEGLLLSDPQNLPQLFRVSDLRLLTSGHSASRQILMDYLAQGFAVRPTELTEQVQNKVISNLSRFRLEEAQSTFIRAELQKKEGDRTAALSLFDQALRLEPENLMILKEKNLLEFELQLFPAYYQSLSQLHQLVPFQPEYRLLLMEAHLKFRAFHKIVDSLEERSLGLPFRDLLTLAAAYSELGKNEEALAVLKGLTNRAKDSRHAYLVHYFLGKAYSALKHPNLAKLHLIRSQRLARSLSPLRWDPYDIPAKQKETAELLTSLDETNS